MNLQHLSNRDFEFSFQQVVKSERKIMHVVLQHIQEAQRRKLYLAKGFSSLFDYLTNELKYSGSSAQRRIQGARMLTAVPSVAEKLETGALNLSQVAELQRASREAEKIHDLEVTSEVKAEILESLIGKNTSETQQAVANALNIPTNDSERITTQKDNSKRFQGMFTEEQFAKFEEVRDFLAHKNFKAKRTQKMSDVFETMFDEILKQKKVGQTRAEKTRSTKAETPKHSSMESEKGKNFESAGGPMNSKNSFKSDDHIEDCHLVKNRSEAFPTVTELETVTRVFEKTVENNQNLVGEPGCVVQAKQVNQAEFETNGQSLQCENRNTESENAEAAVKCGTATTWNSLTPKRKKMILELDRYCQYEDFETGKVCGSTFSLEVDHITPKHQGGSNDPMNLRVLCRAHNQFRNQVK